MEPFRCRRSRIARDAYDDCIAYLDEQLGQLFRNLDSRGLLKNTVVVLTSDHGEHFGEHGTMFGHKFTVYDQETHVPLLVIAPGRVPADRVVAAPVSLPRSACHRLGPRGPRARLAFPGTPAEPILESKLRHRPHRHGTGVLRAR